MPDPLASNSEEGSGVRLARITETIEKTCPYYYISNTRNKYSDSEFQGIAPRAMRHYWCSINDARDELHLVMGVQRTMVSESSPLNLGYNNVL